MGKPGEIRETIMPNGERFSTKIGDDGRAIRERHWTHHDRPWAHSDPHDHVIGWDSERGNPLPGPPINYADGAPKFKNYEVKFMSNLIIDPLDTNMNFKTITEFKWCVHDGGEIEFVWNGKMYSITRDENGVIGICKANKPETEINCKDANDVLKYMVDGVRLRDIITKVKVVMRTI